MPFNRTRQQRRALRRQRQQHRHQRSSIRRSRTMQRLSRRVRSGDLRSLDERQRRMVQALLKRRQAQADDD